MYERQRMHSLYLVYTIAEQAAYHNVGMLATTSHGFKNYITVYRLIDKPHVEVVETCLDELHAFK